MTSAIPVYLQLLKLLHNCEDLFPFYSLSAVHLYDLYHINFTAVLICKLQSLQAVLVALKYQHTA